MLHSCRPARRDLVAFLPVKPGLTSWAIHLPSLRDSAVLYIQGEGLKKRLGQPGQPSPEPRSSKPGLENIQGIFRIELLMPWKGNTALAQGQPTPSRAEAPPWVKILQKE